MNNLKIPMVLFALAVLFLSLAAVAVDQPKKQDTTGCYYVAGEIGGTGIYRLPPEKSINLRQGLIGARIGRDKQDIKVRLIRLVTGEVQEFTVKQIMEDEENPTLHAGDVIEVGMPVRAE